MLDWFSGTHQFHDALLQELVIRGDGTGSLRINTSILTDAVDENGFLISEKHADVILNLGGIHTVNLTDLDMMPGIILMLDITQTGSLFKIEWAASYGVNGHIIARHLDFSLTPKPAEPHIT
ncbi:hypothetical protein [Agrobacterium vaccinii]|uniref:hypothetical protein n=1 Tax=Agrobacterium vaccinii TaxID=2735528 RepID=UPI001E49EB14|nr:hypothetical protein [Agrobacterium vaccinii]UHS57023.1 hypothetical protein HRS00_09530 [Agrobacterium vaccinii]